MRLLRVTINRENYFLKVAVELLQNFFVDARNNFWIIFERAATKRSRDKNFRAMMCNDREHMPNPRFLQFKKFFVAHAQISQIRRGNRYHVNQIPFIAGQANGFINVTFTNCNFGRVNAGVVVKFVAAFTIDRVKLNTVFKLTSSINGLGGAARYMKRWNNEDDVYRWCKFVYHVIETHLDRMYEQIGRAKYGNRSRMTADELSAVASIDTSKLISLYDDLKSLYEKIDNFVNTTDTSNWLIHIKSAQEVTITPMSCADLFKKMIDKYAAKHVLFMSATVLNVKSFCRDMGIDYDDVYHIKAKSPFDPNKSPIYMDLIAPMTQSRFNASFPAVLKEVEEIMDKYPNQKGIIHTGSYKIMSEIINHISEKNGSRLIYRTGFEKNEVLIEMHSQRKDGSVLISPSMMSGVDLKDDLCRFQIIVKLPYASLSDMRVRKKMNQDHEWYTCKMLRSLVQTCGRGTRSQDDWCDNYILDATMEREMTVQNRNILPEYFVERMRNM